MTLLRNQKGHVDSYIQSDPIIMVHLLARGPKQSLFATLLVGLLLVTYPAFDTWAQDSTAPEYPFAGIKNIGFTTKITVGECSDKSLIPPYHALLFKQYANVNGMYRVEINYLDDSGAVRESWIHVNDNEHRCYYDQKTRTMAIDGGGADRDIIVDQTTRLALYPFLFLVPDQQMPLKSTGKMDPAYRGFYIQDLLDAAKWKKVASLASQLTTVEGRQAFNVPSKDFMSNATYTLRFFKDNTHAIVPTEVQKISSSGKVVEDFNVQAWVQRAFNNSLGKEMEISLPNKASFSSSEDGPTYTFTVEMTDLEINSTRLDDKNFYTLDYSMADRIVDENTGKIITVPR